MDDISVLINQAEIIFPGIPKVIYGHSLGGNLVLNYMLKRTPLVYGAIITSPWIELSFQPPKAKILAGKIVRMVAPGFSMDTNLKSEDLSSKNEIAEHYEKDSLVHGKITASNFLNILTAGEYILSNADQTYVQILLLHGKEDKITSYKASEKFANSAGDFVTLKLYDGMYHELHNEQNNEIVFQDILDWLSAL
ncbi:MAG: hypothetical protein C0594_03170 [Marinilabiliales bacterium]|nr:MAG: hypothetical protein C0594_03170 [Marinilabiliales bacterium]